MRRGDKPPDLKQLNIRARALLLALDDALAQKVESAPLVSSLARSEELGPILDELRTDLANLSVRYKVEVGSATDWARRAEIARADGRTELAIVAEQRRDQHLQIAAELGREVAQLREMLAEPA